MVVSQALPVPSRPRIARGTMSTEPSEASSNVKVPNATRPEPRRRTASSMSALSVTSRSHFSPAVNRSAPAGSVTRAASPHPARPARLPHPGDGRRLGNLVEEVLARVGNGTLRTTSRSPYGSPPGRSLGSLWFRTALP